MIIYQNYIFKWIIDFMQMIKGNCIILFLLFIHILAIPTKVYASENSIKTVASYEMLLEEINNAIGTTTIVLTADIVVNDTIEIIENKNIIIKSDEGNYFSITSEGNNDIFYIDNNSELTLERIQLVSNSTSNAIHNEGTLVLRSSEEIIKSDYVKNDVKDNYTQEANAHESFTNFDIATFVISWSGFALAFLTITSGILSFIGFKEIKDLQKAREDVKSLQEKYNAEVIKIEALEMDSKKQLEVLEKKFEDEAHTIMYATYYYSMGSDAYRRAKYGEAIQYLKRSIKYFPKNTDAICLIGRAYAFIGHKDTSYEYYQHALQVDDNCAAAFRGLSAWYRYENPSKALKYAKRAVDNEPEDPEILNYYGLLLRDNKKLPEAMDIFLKSYSIKRLPDTSFFLSILFLAEDSYGRARIYIQDAVDGYSNEDEFGISKPVWKELAIWIQTLLSTSESTRFDNALHQLDKVRSAIDTAKTRRVVVGHIEFVLNSINQTEDYINLSKQRIE